MAKEMTPIDVTHTPEMLRLAEDVATTKVSRVLRRAGEDLAVVMPVSRASERRRIRDRGKSGAGARRHATLESTAGSLQPATRTEDIEAMIRDAKEERAERIMAKLRKP
jgi:hypothetical protein